MLLFIQCMYGNYVLLLVTSICCATVNDDITSELITPAAYTHMYTNTRM